MFSWDSAAEGSALESATLRRASGPPTACLVIIAWATETWYCVQNIVSVDPYAIFLKSVSKYRPPSPPHSLLQQFLLAEFFVDFRLEVS